MSFPFLYRLYSYWCRGAARRSVSSGVSRRSFTRSLRRLAAFAVDDVVADLDIHPHATEHLGIDHGVKPDAAAGLDPERLLEAGDLVVGQGTAEVTVATSKPRWSATTDAACRSMPPMRRPRGDWTRWRTTSVVAADAAEAQQSVHERDLGLGRPELGGASSSSASDATVRWKAYSSASTSASPAASAPRGGRAPRARRGGPDPTTTAATPRSRRGARQPPRRPCRRRRAPGRALGGVGLVVGEGRARSAASRRSPGSRRGGRRRPGAPARPIAASSARVPRALS